MTNENLTQVLVVF